MSELQNRFTARARQVMEQANDEAHRFHHEYVGTEHVLLALAKDEESVAGRVLEKLRSRRQICLDVERIIRKGPVMVTMGRLPQTFQTKMAIYFAMEEACELNHNYIGTEHLLLGLLHEQTGKAACVLTIQGLKLENLRREVLNSLEDGSKSSGHPQSHAKQNPEAESPGQSQLLVGFKSRASLAKRGRSRVGFVILAVAWFILAAGIFGLGLGVNGNPAFATPGAILVGASIIALALARR